MRSLHLSEYSLSLVSLIVKSLKPVHTHTDNNIPPNIYK